MKGAAYFSDDRYYRYLLLRKWGEGGHWVNFLMLNPSTATGKKNDPTVRRCINFAKRMGADGLLVTNLYAMRATDPTELLNFDDPVGPRNNKCIQHAAAKSKIVIVAWGNSVRKIPGYQQRIAEVLEILGYPFHTKLYCFGQTNPGQPRHPLTLRNEVKVRRY